MDTRSFRKLIIELSDSFILFGIFGLIISGYLGIALFLIRAVG